MNGKTVIDYQELKKYIEAHRTLKQKIVCTIGSWDMLHIGHVRYLIKAKNQGDILIVGTDSDRAMKSYKGEERPIIPQEERMEMLCYQHPVDYVTVVDDVDEKGVWSFELIKVIKPDVFIAVEDSYPPDQVEEMKEFCKKVIVYPRQADTSTSGTIEKAVKIKGTKMLFRLKETLNEMENILGNSEK